MASSSISSKMPVGVAATLAIILEVTAPKPGNVHRGADFEDLTYIDFLKSAVLVGPILAQATELGVGRTVLDAVEATRAAVGTNTNLGTVLLIAPLAAVPQNECLREGIAPVLRKLTFADTRHVFEAIRISAAGGMGQVSQADIADAPPADLHLVEAMRLASDRDLVARQYCNGFDDVFRIAEWIEAGIRRGRSLDSAIVHAHVRQLAKEGDSLIGRKCGAPVAEQSRAMAAQVLDAGSPGEEAYERALTDLDFWLRSDGHRRNPGTTADLIAAALFVLLREARLELNWARANQPGM